MKTTENFEALRARTEGGNAERYRLWLLASMQGEPNANENLSMMRNKISAQEAEAAQVAAVDWINQQSA